MSVKIELLEYHDLSLEHNTTVDNTLLANTIPSS